MTKSEAIAHMKQGGKIWNPESWARYPDDGRDYLFINDQGEIWWGGRNPKEYGSVSHASQNLLPDGWEPYIEDFLSGLRHI